MIRALKPLRYGFSSTSTGFVPGHDCLAAASVSRAEKPQMTRASAPAGISCQATIRPPTTCFGHHRSSPSTSNKINSSNSQALLIWTALTLSRPSGAVPASLSRGNAFPSARTLPKALMGLPQITVASTLRVQGKVIYPMLVVMKPQATAEEIQAVCEQIKVLGYRAHPMPGAQRTAIGITGNSGAVDQGDLEELSGVAEVIRVTNPYKLVSRDVKQEDTIITFPGTNASIGGRDLAIVAGPCSIETREQAFAVAEQVARAGAQFFRGGAYKPRTSPYAFQGMGEDGLKIMAEIRDTFGLRIVTEALDNESLDLVADYADVIQIGARNMQNFSLLKRAGRARKPVLLKRGMSATLDELLMAAEYVMSEGNYQVILCERGVRTFADHTRNTLDLSLVPAVPRLSHLPILVDPSHGTGKRNMVLPLARAAVAVGADGLIIEVHNQPDKALSDGAQSLYPDQFVELMDEISPIASAVHRSLPRGITIAEPIPSARG